MVDPIEKGPLIGYERTAGIFTWGQHQIVKLFHESWPVAAVEEEARIGRLVRDIGLPVLDVSGRVEQCGRFGVVKRASRSSLRCWSAAMWARWPSRSAVRSSTASLPHS